MTYLTKQIRLDAVKYYMDTNCTKKAAAEHAGVCVETLSRWVKEYKETGDVGQHKPGNHTKRGRELRFSISFGVKQVYGDFLLERAAHYHVSLNEYMRKMVQSLYEKHKKKQEI